MQPQGGNSQFNPDQNPFEALIKAGAAGQSSPMQMPDMQAPAAASMPQAGGGMTGGMPGQEQMMPDALMPGKTGDATKPLLGAIQQLHGFIAATTDPEEIKMVRQIVTLLTNLIQRDQQRSQQTMEQGMGAQQGASPLQATPPTPQPAQ